MELEKLVAKEGLAGSGEPFGESYFPRRRPRWRGTVALPSAKSPTPAGMRLLSYGRLMEKLLDRLAQSFPLPAH